MALQPKLPSTPFKVASAPALPPAPIVAPVESDVFLESVRVEQEAGRKALEAFQAKTNAEHAAGQRMVALRNKTLGSKDNAPET